MVRKKCCSEAEDLLTVRYPLPFCSPVISSHQAENCVKKQAALPSSEDTRNPKFDGEVLLETLYRDGLAIIDDLLPQDLLDQCIKDVFFEFARDFGSDGLVELGKDPVARRDLNTRSDRVVSLPTNLQQCPGLKALYNILSNEVLARLNLAFLVTSLFNRSS